MSAECACYVECKPESCCGTRNHVMVFCPLHQAAEQMQKVLQFGVKELEFGGEPRTAMGHAIRAFLGQAEKVLTAAEGRTGR